MSNPFRRNRPHFKPLRLESLESRVVPTVHLFVDFGDNFGAAGLSITSAQLTGTFASGGLQGPIGIPNLTYTSLSKNVVGVIDYNGDGMFNAADYADLKRDVLSIVSRVYEPFNVIVEEVANSSVATIQGQMMANNSDPLSSGIHDGYVIVGTAVNSAGVSIGGNSLLGIAGVDSKFFNGPLVTQTNDLDNTTLVFSDTVIGFAANNNEIASLLAFTIAHEAGHSFTLFHVSPFDFFITSAPDTPQLVGSEIMIGAYTGVQQQYIPMLTRMPLSLGDSNFIASNTENPYGVLADFARSNIGAKADLSLTGIGLPNPGPVGPDYVTGSGANDLIVITRTSATTASVSVTPYSDPALTRVADIAGIFSPAYTYNINTTGGVIINGGLGDDRIVIEGNLGPNVSVRGMGGTDSLVVDGKGAVQAIYSPDGTPRIGFDGEQDRRGTVTVGGMTISFQEFELASRVTIQGVSSVTFRSPGIGTDVVDLVNSGNTVSLRGKINGNQDFVPFLALKANTFTVDLGAFETSVGADDVVTLRSNLTAAGLQNVIITTGAGNDTFRIQQGVLNLPVAGGGFTFDGGDGNDKVDVIAAELSIGVNQTFRFNGGAGDDTADFTNSLLLIPFTASLIIDGGDGDDSVTLGTANVTDFTFFGGAGNDTMTVASNLLVQAGNPTFEVNYQAGDGDDSLVFGGSVSLARNAKFNYDAGNGNDTVASTGTTKRTWAIGRQTVTMDNYLGFVGVENVRGGSGVDEFVLTSASDILGELDGGAGQDLVNLSTVSNAKVTLTPSATTAGFQVAATFGGRQLPAVLNADQVRGSAGLGDTINGIAAPARWDAGPDGTTYSVGAYRLFMTGFEVLNGSSRDDLLVIDTALRLLPGTTKPLGAGGVGNIGTSGFGKRLVFNGNSGSDTVRMLGTVAAETFDFGRDTLTVNARTLTVMNVELMELFAGGGDDKINMLAANYVSARIDVFGEAGADTVTVMPTTTTSVRVFGDTPGTSSPSDSLRLMREGIALVGPRPARGATNGLLTFSGGRAPIEFFDVERIFGGASGGSQFLPLL